MTTPDRQLSARMIEAFERRGIDAETVVKYGVFTGRAVKNPDGSVKEVVPDHLRGDLVIFPTFDHGREVNQKYRAPGKRFWQKRTGKATFWNPDVLDSEALQDGRAALLITEGEMDALTAISAGLHYTVSVPDGAPAIPKIPGTETLRDPEDLDPFDPTQDADGKFEFLFNNRDRLRKVKRFVIAADGDGPGRRLAAELVRRLGAARCSFVEYPTEKLVAGGPGEPVRACKDLNEVRMHFGADKVVEIVTNAKPYPVRGVYEVDDYQDRGPLETYATGFDGWAHKLRLFFGEIVIVTGIPGEGKSALANQLVFNLASTHGWKSAICSPEMPTVPVLRDAFRAMYLGREPLEMDVEDKARADSFIKRHFCFIDTDPTGQGDDDEPFDLEWILEKVADSVLRKGIRVVVIDPWNEIEHARRVGETTSDYIARSLRAIRRTARLFGLIFIIVAHPTKEVQGKDGKPRRPTLYDIDGAAHWFNKADHGIVVSRPDRAKNEARIYIDKVKFKRAGKVGVIHMDFEEASGRFLAPQIESLAN